MRIRFQNAAKSSWKIEDKAKRAQGRALRTRRQNEVFFFFVCEAATKFILSRADSPFLPHQLSYSLLAILTMDAQLAAPRPQSSIDCEIDASANFKRLPFVVQFTKTKHSRSDQQKILPMIPSAWKSTKNWRRSARSKLPITINRSPNP